MSLVTEITVLLDTTSIILFISTIVVFFVPIFILFPPIPVEQSDALQQTHTKIGISVSESNLRNQQSSDHDYRPGKPAMIQSLHIYPIKSCQGIEIKRGRVLPKGLEFDRLFTFARLRATVPGAAATSVARREEQQHKRPRWEMVTLRTLPQLANVKVDLWLPDASKASRQLGKVEGRFLVVRFPWKDSGLRGIFQWISAKLSRGLSGVSEKEFLLSMEFPSQEKIKQRNYEYEDFQFFNKTVHSLNLKGEVPPELGRYLGAKTPLALFMMDPAKRREVFRNAPRKEEAGYQPVIDFQDAYPLHLLNLSSIRALEAKLEKDGNLEFLDARRFRPNIIVSGLKEYDEDDWRSIEFSMPPRNATRGAECKFDVSCRTVRCKLPNVDPATGIRHDVEPDKSLRKYRNIDEGAPRSGCFGMQLCPMFPRTDSPEDLELFLEVGMEIEVQERGEHRAE